MKYPIIILSVIAMFHFWAPPSLGQNPHENPQKLQFAVIQEVLQTSNYTYLRVKADTAGQWLAVPSIKLNVGDTCYYNGGLVMPDFTSKELKRTFHTVVFLEHVSKTPEDAKNPSTGLSGHRTKLTTGKMEIKVEPAAGGITIAELLQNKEVYKDKTVKIRGQVTKFNDGIMGKNWAHLQDGTSFGDKFDLTATLGDTLTIGDLVTVEGRIALNKDFGSGYFFEVLMEDAIKK